MKKKLITKKFRPIPAGKKVILELDHESGDPLKTADKELYFYERYKQKDLKKFPVSDTKTLILEEEEEIVEVTDKVSRKRKR